MNLNTEQCHIVMYNRAWCKSYINAVRHGEKKKGYRIFLSGPGWYSKSHVVHLIQRDMSHSFKHTVKTDDDQPTVDASHSVWNNLDNLIFSKTE